MNTLIIHHHQNHLQSLSMNLINRDVQPPLGFHTLSTELMLIAEIWRDSASIVCDGRYRKLAAVGNFPGLLGFCFYSYGYCNCFARNRLPHCLIPFRKNNKLVVWRWAFPKHNLPPAFISRKIEHYGLHGRLRYSPPPICNISSPSKSSTSCHSALALDFPLWFFKSPNSSQFSLKKKTSD